MTALELLDLTENAITGTIPSSLCGDASQSALLDFLMGRNGLSGPLTLANCTNLVLIDVPVRQAREEVGGKEREL